MTGGFASASGDGIVPGNIDPDASAKEVAKVVDLDKLRVAFSRYAGPDEQMDRQEYIGFARSIKLPVSAADKLWAILDSNGDGRVTADEFTSALESMTGARAWNRYCPNCKYDNTCSFCVRRSIDCRTGQCNDQRFCKECAFYGFEAQAAHTVQSHHIAPP